MKTPLTAADFTYLGCFKLPRYPFDPNPLLVYQKPGSPDPFSRLSFSAYASHGSPLALRVVNGERRFFAIGHSQGGGKVTEVALPPTLAQTVASAPTAATVNYWNTSPYTIRPADRYPTGNVNGVLTKSLFWDETRQLLWWTFGDGFDLVGKGPTIGYAKLTNPAGPASTATAFGPFDLDSATQKTTNVRGGLMELPPSVRPLVGDRRLGVMNRLDSILGLARFGHSVIAFDEPQDASVPTVSVGPPGPTIWGPSDHFVAGTQDVMRYGLGNPATKDSHGNYNYLSYLHRQSDYSVMGLLPSDPPQKGGAGGTNVNPSGGVGYFQGSVDLFTGSVWIETTSKAGMLVAGGQSSGRNWYTSNGYVPEVGGVKIPNDPRPGGSGWYNGVFNGVRIGCEFFNPAFYLYSEQDLINGAMLGYGHWQQNPMTTRFPVADPIGAWTFGAPVFDAETRRLYVSQDRAYASGSEKYPVVHCWEVLDGAPAPGQPPQTPTNLRARPV